MLGQIVKGVGGIVGIDDLDYKLGLAENPYNDELRDEYDRVSANIKKLRGEDMARRQDTMKRTGMAALGPYAAVMNRLYGLNLDPAQMFAPQPYEPAASTPTENPYGREAAQAQLDARTPGFMRR